MYYAVRQRYSDNDIAIFVKKYYAEAVTCVSSSNIPSALVYVNTQNDAEKYARLLQESLSGICGGVRVGFYHAGMPSATRSRVHQEFCQDTVHVIVATVAFGMGMYNFDDDLGSEFF